METITHLVTRGKFARIPNFCFRPSNFTYAMFCAHGSEGNGIQMEGEQTQKFFRMKKTSLVIHMRD